MTIVSFVFPGTVGRVIGRYGFQQKCSPRRLDTVRLPPPSCISTIDRVDP